MINKKKTAKKASSKKANPKCRVIKVRRKISMGKGKRPRILQVRRKVCNPGNKRLVLTYGKLPTEKQFLDHYDYELLGSDFRIIVNSPQKNKWDQIHGDFNSTQLWDLIKLAKKENSTGSLAWVNAILDNLNIEWI